MRHVITYDSEEIELKYPTPMDMYNERVKKLPRLRLTPRVIRLFRGVKIVDKCKVARSYVAEEDMAKLRILLGPSFVKQLEG